MTLTLSFRSVTAARRHQISHVCRARLHHLRATGARRQRPRNAESAGQEGRAQLPGAPRCRLHTAASASCEQTSYIFCVWKHFRGCIAFLPNASVAGFVSWNDRLFPSFHPHKSGNSKTTVFPPTHCPTIHNYLIISSMAF